MRKIQMNINIHAIIYNYTYRYWYMWKYRNVEGAEYLKEKRLWNSCQVDRILGQYCRFLTHRDKAHKEAVKNINL